MTAGLRSLLAAVAIMGGTTALPAAAHGDAHKNHDKRTAPRSQEETAFGREGDPKRAVRTITVNMYDNMRFDPAEIRVRQGETVKLVVRNKGKAMHEMVLGTMDELKAHGEMMRKFPDMEHDEPYMAHVKPGKAESMVWQFTKAGEFYYGCLVPGHFESGMIGKIRVTAK